MTTTDSEKNMDDFIAALRSGKYIQGQYRLKQGGCHCVWGVACDLFNPDGWNPTTVDVAKVSSTFMASVPALDGRLESRLHLSIPPRNVWEWLGIHLHQPFLFKGLDVPISLMEANDRLDPISFEAIADGLEAWRKEQ